MRIRVSDADRNASATAADTLSVLVSSTKETSAESIVLTETGVSTGVFSASVLFDPTGAVAKDGALQVDAGDMVTVNYNDPADDFGNASTLTSTSFYGMTEVPSGFIMSNTTWTKANSPYFLTGDVIIPDSVTLTIEPGASVRFKAKSDDMSAGEDQNRIEIRVSGTLKANGNATDSISFISNAQNPASGDWYGIFSYDANTNEMPSTYSSNWDKVGSIDISYAKIAHYIKAISADDYSSEYFNNISWGWGNSLSRDSIKVHNSVFRAGGAAYYCDEYWSFRPVEFTNNRVYNGEFYSYGRSAYKKVENNIFHNDRSSGTDRLYVKGDQRGSSDQRRMKLSVKNNTMHYGYIEVDANSEVSSSSAQYAAYIDVSNNTVHRNSNAELEVRHYNYGLSMDSIHVTVSNNSVQGRNVNGDGIRVQLNGQAPSRATVNNNTTLSTRYGLYLYSARSSKWHVENNTIDSTYYNGIYKYNGSANIIGNTVEHAGRYTWSGNQFNGVLLDASSNYPGTDTLKNNTIRYNGKWSSPTSSVNASYGIGGVVLNGSVDAVINGNNIYENNGHDIINLVSKSVAASQDARYNFWGDSATAEMNAGANPKNISVIHDEYDDALKGFVNYGQYYTSPCDIKQGAASIVQTIKANNGISNVTLSYPGNYTSMLWSTGDSTQSIYPYSNLSNTYWVTTTDADGCTLSDTININTSLVTFRVDMRNQTVDSIKGVHVAGSWDSWQPGALEMLDADGDLIYERTDTLIVSDPVEFKFINGNAWTDPHDIMLSSCASPNGNRTYTVASTNDTLTAFHLSSCSEASPVDPLVDIQLAQCNDASIELSAGSSVSNVVWNTGDTTNSITASSPGLYWFKALYPQGVVVLDSTTVPASLSIPDTVITASGSLAFCSNESVTLSAASGPELSYTESFNSGLPTNWTSSSNTTQTWQNVVSHLGNTIDNSSFMFLNDDAASQSAPAINASLTSPKFNAVGHDTVSLEFDHYYRSYPGTVGIVEVFNGNSWVQIDSISSTKGSWASPAHETYDITSHQNADLKVRLTYSDGLGAWGWYWAIDNVKIRRVSADSTSSNLASYQWNTGETTQSITVNQPGSYYAVVTSTDGCTDTTASFSTTVYVGADTSVAANGSLNFCSYDDVILTAAAGQSYAWSTGDTTQSITVNQAGSYYAVITSADGCVDTTDTFVTSTQMPDTSVSASGALDFCSYDDVTLTAAAGQSYAWSTGDTTQSITMNQAGSYYAVVTDNLGCVDTSATFITTVFTDPDTAVTASGPLDFCSYESVSLTAATGHSYLWSTGATTQSINFTQPGDYFAIVTTADGCVDTTATYTTTLYADADTAVTASGPLTFCDGGSVTLTAAAGQTYVWNTGDTTQSVTRSHATSLYAIVTTVNGCVDTTATYTTSLFADPDTTVTVSGPLTFCSDASVTLTAAAGQSYVWSNGAATQSINVSQPGTYSATVASVNGCIGNTALYTTSLYADPDTSVTVSGSLDFCSYEDVTLTAASGQSYLWSNGDTSQSVTVNMAGAYYAVVITADGCVDSTSVYSTTIFPDADISVAASGALDFCSYEDVTLTAAAGQSYLWNTGDTSQSITSTQAGSYSFIATTINGCVDTSAVYSTTIFADADTSVAVSQTLFCASDSAILTAAPGQSYLWNNGDTTQVSIVNTTGDYFVTATTTNGCFANSDTIAITVVPDVVLPQIISNGLGWVASGSSTSFTITTDTNQTYQWNVGGGVITSGQGTDSLLVTWGIPDTGVTVWLVVSNGVCTDSTSISLVISGIGFSDRDLIDAKLYPNPTDGYFTVEIPEQFIGAQMSIIDGVGRVLEHVIIRDVKTAIDLRARPKGAYRVQIKSNREVKTLPIIIQ